MALLAQGAARSDDTTRTILRRIDEAHRRGLRNVAIVEIVKGVIVLIAALALAALLQRQFDLQDAAYTILEFLRIDPDKRIPSMFISAADRAMSMNVAVMLAVSVAYSGMRFIEGYGLWRGRIWAEWLAIVSCSLFVPIEIWHIVRRVSAFNLAFFFTNLIILAYIIHLRVTAHRKRKDQAAFRGTGKPPTKAHGGSALGQ